MKVIDDKFIAYRAEQLAVVHLTRREDLRLKRPGTDFALDFIVSIVQQRKEAGVFFGVRVKGVMSKDKLSSSITRSRPSVASMPFPVVLLEFTMDKDEAYWAWLKPPIGKEQVKSTVSKLEPLTENALDMIVDQVVAWYEARRVDAAA